MTRMPILICSGIAALGLGLTTSIIISDLFIIQNLLYLIMENEKDTVVMAYRTFKLGEYVDIKLGDGTPQDIRTIAEANGKTPQIMMRLLLDDFLKTVRAKAQECNNRKNPCI